MYRSSSNNASKYDHVKEMNPSKRVRNVVTATDHEELKKAYTFVLQEDDDCNNNEDQQQQEQLIATAHKNNNNNNNNNNTTWQERMVQKYHSHLYKSHVIADFSQQTKKHPNNIGLRWRIKAEVENGKGFETCGNKHCPCYYQGIGDYFHDHCTSANNAATSACSNPHHDNHTNRVNYDDILNAYNELPLESEFDVSKKWSNMKKKCVEEVIRWKKSAENRKALWIYQKQQVPDPVTTTTYCEREEKQRLQFIPHGLGLFDYTVHFSYREHNEYKEELVQLKLCLRCAPKLFYGKGGVLGALNARRKNQSKDDSINKHRGNDQEMKDSSYSSSSSSSSSSSGGSGSTHHAQKYNQEEGAEHEFQDYTRTIEKKKKKEKSRKKEKKRKHHYKEGKQKRRRKDYSTTSSKSEKERKKKYNKDMDLLDNDDNADVDLSQSQQPTNNSCKKEDNNEEKDAIESEKMLLSDLDHSLQRSKAGG